jgi:hypothetical protein
MSPPIWKLLFATGATLDPPAPAHDQTVPSIAKMPGIGFPGSKKRRLGEMSRESSRPWHAANHLLIFALPDPAV